LARSLLQKKGGNTMKELYKELEMESVIFETEDVITASGDEGEDMPVD